MINKEIWIKCSGDTETVTWNVVDVIMGIIAPKRSGDYLVVAYTEDEKKMRKFINLPKLNKEAVSILKQYFGEENVKVVEN